MCGSARGARSAFVFVPGSRWRDQWMVPECVIRLRDASMSLQTADGPSGSGESASAAGAYHATIRLRTTFSTPDDEPRGGKKKTNSF